MSRPELKQAKAGAAMVRAILNNDWQPIPGVPEDEWDSYVWPVLALLQRSAPRAEVETYLRWAADVNIGCPVPEPDLARVLDKLMALSI